MSGCFVALLLLSTSSFHCAAVAAVFPRNPFDGTDKADTSDVDAAADDDDADVVADETGVAAFSFLIGVLLLLLLLLVCIVI